MGMYDTTEWDDEHDEQDEGGNPNSSAMRQLRAADKAKAKRIKELEEQLSSLSKSSRERSIKDVLDGRGLNPKIATFIPPDIEPTEDAVSKWLDEYGELFGAAPQQQASAVPPDQIAALRQMDAIMAQTSSPAGADEVRSRIANAESPEELDRIIFGQ